jgi:hypothetical protein
MPWRAAAVDFVDQKLARRCRACAGGQRGLVQPSTENTPRICASWLGTSCSGRGPGVAEELVERLFHLAQCRAQFVDHAAHGLAVTDAAVQLLHPGFQRLGLGTRGDLIQALGQAALRSAIFDSVGSRSS